MLPFTIIIVIHNCSTEQQWHKAGSLNINLLARQKSCRNTTQFNIIAERLQSIDEFFTPSMNALHCRLVFICQHCCRGVEEPILSAPLCHPFFRINT
jgi:hypothetical protein